MLLSANFLNWSTAEGHQEVFQPSVLQIHLNLWGRDVLTDTGVSLTTAPTPDLSNIQLQWPLWKKWDIFQVRT